MKIIIIILTCSSLSICQEFIDAGDKILMSETTIYDTVYGYIKSPKEIEPNVFSVSDSLHPGDSIHTINPPDTITQYTYLVIEQANKTDSVFVYASVKGSKYCPVAVRDLLLPYWTSVVTGVFPMEYGRMYLLYLPSKSSIQLRRSDTPSTVKYQLIWY